jgi:hypothetical protein
MTDTRLVAEPEEATVTMFFPTRTHLERDGGGGSVTFEPGVQEVPASLADHWWLKSQATPYTPTPAEVKARDDARTEQERQATADAEAAQKAAEAEVAAAEAQATAEIEAAKAKAASKVANVKSKAAAAKAPLAKATRGPVVADRAVTTKHVAYLQAHGHADVTNVAQAQAYVATLNAADRDAFFAAVN